MMAIIAELAAVLEAELIALERANDTLGVTRTRAEARFHQARRIRWKRSQLACFGSVETA